MKEFYKKFKEVETHLPEYKKKNFKPKGKTDILVEFQRIISIEQS